MSRFTDSVIAVLLVLCMLGLLAVVLLEVA